MSIPSNSRHVKPPRRYDSTRRRAQAAETRQDILKAALQLFLEGGYAGTTINDVAAAAGVAGESPPPGFGGHGGMFQRVAGAGHAGGGAPRGRPPPDAPLAPAASPSPRE